MKTVAMLFVLISALSFSSSCFASSYSFNFGALEETSTYEESVTFGTGKNYNLQRREISIPKDYGRLGVCRT
jgi:hypothetical protein